MWDKFKKVNGNYKPRTISPLERGENKITSPDEIADNFTDYYTNKSRDHHNKVSQGNTKEEERRRPTI